MANAVKKSLRCWCLLGAGHPITLDKNGPLYPFLTPSMGNRAPIIGVSP